jgi:pSer/pThr/pTyr-binding forkhead associated (FHA) protein
MDHQLDDAAHPLQGPHVEVRVERRSGFAPLRLVVQPGNGRVEVTRTQAILGRHSGADVRLPFPEVSRRHARVQFENGQWRIVDMDSLNGVWINGERMFESALYDGDHVRLGSCLLTVEQGTAVRVVLPMRKSDPDMEVLKSIADVLPRQAG